MNAVSSSVLTEEFTNLAFQRRIASILSVAVTLVGIAVLAGWFLNISAIPSFLSRGASMKANASLGFVLIGVALWLSQRGDPRGRTAAAVLGAIAGTIALLTLLEYASGLSFGIDVILVPDQDPTKTSHPGRMSPVSASNLLLLGIAIVLLHRGHDAGAQILAAIATFIALLGVAGYLYAADSLVSIGPYTTVALISELTVLIATVAILLTRPDRAVMGIIHSRTSGGLMSRRLLPAAIVIPIVIGCLRLYGQRIGLYDTEFGLAIMVLGTITFLCALIVWNASALHHMELQQKRLEAQFQQSRKMEAIGQLASGIAHDFNNLLTVISGHSSLMLQTLNPDDRNYGSADQIQKAGSRAAALTRQLLVFSRRQPVRPTLIDLNELVRELQKFLDRVIGEHIELSVRLTSGLWPIKGDRGQMDQMLTNLAVNARDAMPQGGRLVIETDNVILDDTFAHQHLGTQLGPHVMLAVSDTGIGMDKETQSHIFEPFFTTKEPGKGTGLGLATVYGIVKQASGSIWVYSEPGKGTTFRIYFPRAESAKPIPESGAAAMPRPGVSLTILVVEDDDMVRKLACDVLRAQVHIVLEARNPAQALTLSREFPARIDLLVSDMIMPGVTGRALFEQLSISRPEMKVIYMSGYTDKVIGYHDTLDPTVPFLQKPFTPEELVRKINELFAGSGSSA